MCSKSGFSVLRTINIIFLSLAIVLHLTGIVYPVWSQFRYVTSGIEIVYSSQGLWSIDVKTDKVDAFSSNEERDTGWKDSVVALEMTSLGVAAVGLLALVLQTSIIRIRASKLMSILLRIFYVFTFTAAGIQGISGLLLYWTQKTKVFSDLAKDPKNKIPLDEEESGVGMYCTAVSSAIYIVAVLLEFIISLTEESKSTVSNQNSSHKNETRQTLRKILPMQRSKQNDAFDF